MKIEPFKMRVTPEQSKRVQEIIFENGGEWRDGQTTVINTNFPCLAFELRGDGNVISGWSDPFAGSPTFLDAEVPEIMYYEFINKYVKQKRTFKIPENTREISVSETDGRIVIEFVPEVPGLTERERIRAFLYQRGWEGASEDSIADIEAYIKHREAQQCK